MHTQYASTDAILATQSLDIDTPTAHDSRTGSIRHAHGPQYSYEGGQPLAIQQIHVRAGYTAQRCTHNTPSQTRYSLLPCQPLRDTPTIAGDTPAAYS